MSAALKEKLVEYQTTLDGKSVRERVLLLLAAVFVLFLFMDLLFLSPGARERNQLDKSIEGLVTDIGKLETEVSVLTRVANVDPDREQKQALAQLQRRLASVDAEIEKLSLGLVPADQLAGILRRVLSEGGELRLRKLTTWPVREIVLESGVESEDSASRSVSGVDVGVSVDSDSESAGVYRHGVQLVLQGRYFDIVSYLRALEVLPWQIYWETLEYSVETYPRATVTLGVYTISTEQGSLGV